MSRRPSRRCPRVTVRPIPRHGCLPPTVAGARVLLLRTNAAGKVEATQVFMPEATTMISAPGFTHYGVLPYYL